MSAGSDGEDQLAGLAARVAQLEAQVAELSRARGSEAVTIRPVTRTTDKAWRPPVLPETIMAAIPPKPPPPPPMPATVEVPGQTLENRLGAQLFNVIGIVAILVGTSWFLKLAIERGWVGPVARVLIGMAAGVGLVLWSERFRRKGFGAFSYSLKGVGSSVLYLSLWAAFQLYHRLPAGVALTAMVLVTAWNGFMAWSQDAELLAAYGLVGGFATPLLLSTGGNHETFLFTYVAAIDVAAVLLLRWKPWRRLLLPAMAGTVGYFIGWYAEFFHRTADSRAGAGMDGEAWETAAFAVLFFALFTVVSMKGFSRVESGRADVLVPVLVPLANAAFVSLALYSVMEDSGLHGGLAWLMVGLAAVYLGLMRVQATAVAGAMHLAAAVVFLTVAIPLKASGHSLTTAWLIEGLVLYWASTRFEREGGAASKVLQGLSMAGYGLGLASLMAQWVGVHHETTFFNRDLGAALLAIGVLGGAVWLAMRSPIQEGQERSFPVVAGLVAIDGVAVLLCLREVGVLDFRPDVHAAFASATFWTALVGLAVLAAAAWVGYRQVAELGLKTFAGVTLVAFNLLTILSVEREIGALWHRTDANLQRSLAISGFLMAYGAGLLAAGFWRRSAFVRWQGLVLLLFTILKVFFYDVSGLSQGYRVASFLGLGALLMAVSFAYQKDWLGLKAAASAGDEV